MLQEKKMYIKDEKIVNRFPQKGFSTLLPPTKNFMIPKLKEDYYVPFLSENGGKCFVNSVHFFSFLYPYL